MSLYTSEASQFLASLSQQDPNLEQRQSEARARMWDKQVDAEQWAQWQAEEIPQNAYVYATSDLVMAVRGQRR